MSTKKRAHLIAAIHSTGSHLRGWRHPNAPARPATDTRRFIDAVRELERGLFDAVFIGETTGVMPGPIEAYRSDSMVNDSLDPTLLLAAVAAATTRIGLITTASTSLTQPYSLARLLASLDHLSHGRAGWNVVTSRFETEARNFGIDPGLLRAPVRYDVADEFVDLAKQLWDSIDTHPTAPSDGSVTVRRLDHHSSHFQMTGTLNMPRPPQGHPVILQAGMSEAGRELTAREADLALAPGGGWHSRETREDLRARAARHGRDPDSVLVLAVLPAVIVADSRAQAEREAREFAELLAPNERQQPGILAGTADDIADIFENWLDAEAADGFAIGFPYLQGPVEAFTDLVIPELQRRGIYPSDYAGNTLRKNLGLPQPHLPGHEARPAHTT